MEASQERWIESIVEVIAHSTTGSNPRSPCTRLRAWDPPEHFLFFFNMETPGIGSQRRITSTVSVQQVGAQVGHTTRRACGGMEPRKQRSEIMKSLRSSKFQLPYPAGAVDPEVDLQVAVRAHLKAKCGHHSIADGAELTMPHS